MEGFNPASFRRIYIWSWNPNVTAVLSLQAGNAALTYPAVSNLQRDLLGQRMFLHRTSDSFLIINPPGKMERKISSDRWPVKWLLRQEASKNLFIHDFPSWIHNNLYKNAISLPQVAWFIRWGICFISRAPEWNNTPRSNKTENSFHKSLSTYQISHTEFLLNPGTFFFASELAPHVAIENTKTLEALKRLQQSDSKPNIGLFLSFEPRRRTCYKCFQEEIFFKNDRLQRAQGVQEFANKWNLFCHFLLLCP